MLFWISFLMTALSGCSVFGIRSGYEQLSYTVIDKVEDVEIRQYPARTVAEVRGVKDDNEAFRVLFRYISGQNGLSEKVAMTSPVQVNSESTKIQMTVPVEALQSERGEVSMRFFLPRSYTVETAPKPNDDRIRILSLPEETFAAVRYSGFRTEERFRSESDRLADILAHSKWKTRSMPSFLGYDPPFALPFLRRNEAIIKVEAR